jgi:phosphonate transport system substrate-binding protein
MSEPQSPSLAPSASPTHFGKFTLFISVFFVVVAAGVYAYFHFTNPSPAPVDEGAAIKTFIAGLGKTQKLDAAYTDANGDLVADPPTDPAKYLNVNEIMFSVVASEDAEKAQAHWKDFMTALSKATGKPVKYFAEIDKIDDQVRAIREGRLHVTAFNTGQVSNAVNTAGFVPLFCIADKEGKYGYEMEILVPAASPIQTPADLKGKTITLTSLSSNSGGKAPLVILKEKFGLLPGRDYHYTFSGDHVRSVKELASGHHEAVCVANDQVARAVGAGLVKREQFRSIYKSENFPPLCFGVPHNLPPELVAKIKQVFTNFSFDGTSVGDLYNAQGKSKFAPVDYAKDWKLIREVDDSLSHLFDSK